VRKVSLAPCLLWLFVWGLAACSQPRSVEAPPPALADDTDSPPELPPSTLNVPVSYDLTPIIAKLEEVIPRSWGDIAERMTLPRNRRVSVAFEVKREPFKVSLDGETARMSALIHYSGRGWYDPPVGPTVSASCGVGQTDARPRAGVSVSARMGLTENWKLQARTRVDRVAPASNEKRDECRVTVIGIDVTERVLNAARGVLVKNTPAIDRAIAGLDIRSRFEEWWNILQSPIELTDSVWLMINPTTVRKGPAAGEGTMLIATVGLTASPRVILGPRPVVTPKPLPPLDTATVTEGLHILAEGVIDYSTASQLLTRELRGRRFERAGRSLRIRKVTVSGIGGGRLAVQVEFDGSVAGHVYFVGTPRFDEAKGELYVPDLDFDVATSHLLVSGLDWIKHDDVVQLLRSKAHIPVADGLAQASRYLHDGLNRNLSRDVRLEGQVQTVRAIDVHATRRAILVHAHATATARMIVQTPKETPVTQ
jgi:hypothetical protein